MVAGIVISNVFMHFTVGLFQGLQRYNAIAIQGIIFAVARLAFCVAFVWGLGWSINGALAGSVAATIVGIAWGIYTVRSSLSIKISRLGKFAHHLLDLSKSAIPIWLVILSISTLGNIDIPFVKHFCTEAQTGQFSVAAVLGRTAFLLPGMLIFVIYPETIRNNLSGRNALKQLSKDLTLTGVLSIGMIAMLSLFSEFFITTLFGTQYDQAGHYLTFISLNMGVVALINVFFNHHLAKRQFLIFAPAVAIYSITFLLIEFKFNKTPLQIVTTLLFGSAAVVMFELIVLTLGLLKQSKTLTTSY